MLTNTFAFDAAWMVNPGIVVILLVLGFTGWNLRKRGLSLGEIGALVLLRGLALAGLLVLAARPVSVHSVAKNSDP